MSSCQTVNDDTVGESEVDKLSNRARRRLIRKRKEKDGRKEEQNSKKQKVADGSLETKPLDSISEEILGETSYYIENGLRKVYPYDFTFSTHTKGRWFGKSIKEVFSSEFTRNSSVFNMAMENGNIKVNDKVVDEHHKLRNGDFLSNLSHRHEMPVTADPIRILADDDDILVVDKPSSIPVHPCGRYRHNSVTMLLAKVYGYKNLRVTFRLDRLTSGLLIFGKNASTTIKIQDAIQNRQVQKEYLSRVVGNFPDENLTCDEPLGTLMHSLGVFHVSSTGKHASTSFQKLFYDEKTNTSVVKCLPHTGRTHQIRVHLQYLGFPIVNDPVYNSEAWGPNRGKDGDCGKSQEELIAALVEQNNRTYDILLHNVTLDSFKKHYFENTLKYSNSCSVSSSIHTSQEEKEVLDDKSCLLEDKPTTEKVDCVPNHEFDINKMVYDKACADCLIIYKDPKPCDLVMFLHAHRYKCSNWEYVTEIPYWAKEEWIPND